LFVAIFSSTNHSASCGSPRAWPIRANPSRSFGFTRPPAGTMITSPLESRKGAEAGHNPERGEFWKNKGGLEEEMGSPAGASSSGSFSETEKLRISPVRRRDVGWRSVLVLDQLLFHFFESRRKKRRMTGAFAALEHCRDE